ncbi:MAG TPA: DNA polymerase III subunit beta, partial [Actinopolymorphaceae bacterium]
SDELRAALRRVCIVADRFAAVVLEIEEDAVTVRAAGDVATRGRERVACTLEGHGTTTAFNAGFLLDGLDFLDVDEVRLGFQEGIRPALMRPASGDEGALYVVQPRRLPA